MTTLDKNCTVANWKEVASEVSLDLWICRKFKCLPTEDRFKEMTEHMKVLLFYGYLVSPDDEVIRQNYLSENEESLILTESDKDDFKKVLGYSEESIENIEKNLRAAGMLE